MVQTSSAGRRYTVRKCQRLCDGLRGRYVAVVEQHRNGWPHLNVLFHWPWLANKTRCAPQRIVARRNGGEGRVLGSCKLLEQVVASGFGYQSHASIAIHRDKLASYLVAAAAGIEKTAAEVAKLAQIPVESPQGFRRLRAGRGFLEARFTQEGLTGCIVTRGNHRWRPVSRRRADTRVWIADSEPRFRPREPTTWIDARDWTVYLPDWPGWERLETIDDEALERWLVELDLREPGGPPKAPRLVPV